MQTLTIACSDLVTSAITATFSSHSLLRSLQEGLATRYTEKVPSRIEAIFPGRAGISQRREAVRRDRDTLHERSGSFGSGRSGLRSG